MGIPGTTLLRKDLLSGKDPTPPQTIAPEAPETTIFRRNFETALDLEAEKYTARMTPTSVTQMYLPRRIDGHRIECSRTSASQAAAGLPHPEDRLFPMPLLAWIPLRLNSLVAPTKQSPPKISTKAASPAAIVINPRNVSPGSIRRTAVVGEEPVRHCATGYTCCRRVWL